MTSIERSSARKSGPRKSKARKSPDPKRGVKGAGNTLQAGKSGFAERGRPGRLSRHAIIEVASEMVGGEFTISRVARKLGVSPQALYYYFPNKDVLDRAITLHFLGQVPIPDPAGMHWKDWIRAWVTGCRKFMQESGCSQLRIRMPNSLSVFRVGDSPSEKLLDLFNAYMGVMQRGGFRSQQAAEVWLYIQNYLQCSDFHTTRQADMDELWKSVHSDLASAGKDHFSNLKDFDQVPAPDFEALYRRGLDVLVDGIAAVYHVN
jgi:AcrR family transcriptional regulator